MSKSHICVSLIVLTCLITPVAIFAKPKALATTPQKKSFPAAPKLNTTSPSEFKTKVTTQSTQNQKALKEEVDQTLKPDIPPVPKPSAAEIEKQNQLQQALPPAATLPAAAQPVPPAKPLTTTPPAQTPPPYTGFGGGTNNSGTAGSSTTTPSNTAPSSGGGWNIKY